MESPMITMKLGSWFDWENECYICEKPAVICITGRNCPTCGGDLLLCDSCRKQLIKELLMEA